MVYIVYDSGKIISCGCGDNNLAGAGIDMSLCLLFAGVESGALKHYVYLQITPRAVVCIRECIDLDCLTVYKERQMEA